MSSNRWKYLVAVTAMALLSAASYGQSIDDSSDSDKAQVSGRYQPQPEPKAQAIRFGMENTVDFGTLISTGSLTDGDRSNFTMWNPKFFVLFGDRGEGSLNVPFLWTTDQSGNTDRFILQPDLAYFYNAVKNENVKFKVGMDVLLPMTDTSIGLAEVFEFWEFAPAAKIDARISNTTFHFLADTSVAFDTNSTFAESTSDGEGFPLSVPLTISRPMTIRATAGVAQEWNNGSMELAYHIANGLGEGHITSSFESFSSNQDVNPVDLSTLELRGAVNLAKDTQLTGLIAKGLKEFNGANSSSLLFGSAMSHLGEEGSDLTVGVGLSQVF